MHAQLQSARKFLGISAGDAALEEPAETEGSSESLALMEVQEEIRTSLSELLSIMDDTDRRLKKKS